MRCARAAFALRERAESCLTRAPGRRRDQFIGPQLGHDCNRVATYVTALNDDDEYSHKARACIYRSLCVHTRTRVYNILFTRSPPLRFVTRLLRLYVYIYIRTYVLKADTHSHWSCSAAMFLRPHDGGAGVASIESEIEKKKKYKTNPRRPAVVVVAYIRVPRIL